MKLRIFLESSGHERLVTHGPQHLFAWDFIVRLPGMPEPANATYLGDLDVVLPTREQAAPIAAHYLEQRIANIRAEAERDALEVSKRLANVLALEGPRQWTE